MLHCDITDKIIASFYQVYNTLGYGFLEKVYESAMIIELEKANLHVAQQQNIKVYYDNQEIGDYFSDILVNNSVILELKSAETLNEAHKAQLTNYLKATEMEVSLLLNFGKKPQFQRIIFTNDRKRGNRTPI